MSMIAEQIATKLHRMERRHDIGRSQEYKDAITEAKNNGCVVVYGESDDLMIFDGYIDDEVGAYDGGEAWICNDGLLSKRAEECAECPHYHNVKSRSIHVTLEWEKNGYSWWAGTLSPFSPFDIDYEGKPWCRGIVIDLNEAKEYMQVQA